MTYTLPLPIAKYIQWFWRGFVIIAALLNLFGYTNTSWWLVFAPFYIPLTVWAAPIIAFLFYLIVLLATQGLIVVFTGHLTFTDANTPRA